MHFSSSCSLKAKTIYHLQNITLAQEVSPLAWGGGSHDSLQVTEIILKDWKLWGEVTTQGETAVSAHELVVKFSSYDKCQETTYGQK